MAVKLRLKRMGSKKRPFYRIVAADSREKRDGNFIELIGTYSTLEDNKADINEELAKQQQNAANKDFLTALYYLDTSSEYIVPEVRNIKYERIQIM